MRLRSLFLWIAIASGFALANPAAAHAYALRGVTCTGGASSYEAAFALGLEQLDCGGGRFNRREAFVRTHASVAGISGFAGRDLVWQTDPSAFATMLVRFTYADGESRLVDVDSQMPVRNWTAGNRFSIPVPKRASPLAAIDMVVERPQSLAPLTDARLIDAGTALHDHLLRGLLYALVCGLLLVPIIYNLLFYQALKVRFSVWHTVMVLGMLLFVVSNSGLIFLAAPDLPLLARWQINTVSLTFVVASATLFAIGLFEDLVLPARLRRTLLLCVLAMVLIKLVALFNFDGFRIAVFQLYFASFVPIGMAMAATIWVGIKRGSRAAKYLAVAFSGMLLVGALRMLGGLGLVSSATTLDDSFYVAFVLLALGSSAGVSDRFVVIKEERDNARLQAQKLGEVADTDGLTGLLNRRAFARLAHLRSGQGLIIADIDRFKAINDNYGHTVGDAVLHRTAVILRERMKRRRDAAIFRLGGEEFAILFDAGSEARLAEVAEELRQAMEDGQGVQKTRRVPQPTMSLGGVMGHGQAMRSAFENADAALYRAKEDGRNRAILNLDGNFVEA